MSEAKTLTFAAVHMSVAFAVASIMTGDWRIGGALALVEPCVNTVAFYLHERGWAHWQRLRQTRGSYPGIPGAQARITHG